jgi:hypothetical protein
MRKEVEVSGDTGQLLAELTGHCSLCDAKLPEDGGRHICLKGKDTGTETQNLTDDPGYTFETGGATGRICGCGSWVAVGEPHKCFSAPPDPGGTNFEPGYQCVFCNVWIPFGQVHTCLYNNVDSLKLDRIIDLLEQITRKVCGYQGV